MSYIRAGGEPHWIENAHAEGMYVYSDGHGMNGVPRSEPEFVELAMRILFQSGELDEDELISVRDAFVERMDIDNSWEVTTPPTCDKDGCMVQPYDEGLCLQHYCKDYDCE